MSKATLFHGLHFSTHWSLVLIVYLELDGNLADNPTDRHSTIGPLVIAFSSVIPSSHYIIRSNQLLHNPVVKPSVMQFLILLISFLGYGG